MPGENNRLPWVQLTLERAINQEEGSLRPILVYVYAENMNEDCCAANFERSIFRYKPVVDVALNFKCVKTTFAQAGDLMVKRFELDRSKPALLLLDVEGGLLSKVQTCTDPKKYQKVISSALALNEKRVELKEKHLGMQREARQHIDDKQYAKALLLLERLSKQKDKLTGQVLAKVEADQADLVSIGRELLLEAASLRAQKQLLTALELFKEIEREFARIDDLARDARRCAAEVRTALRDMGVSNF
ncbi:MAG: hypothetical protein ACKVX7_07200 [Planctomycetota bacterium]